MFKVANCDLERVLWDPEHISNNASDLCVVGAALNPKLSQVPALPAEVPNEPVPRILELRGQRVLLDSDLAALYGVTTKRLNEQVRRNADRFPPDFILENR